MKRWLLALTLAVVAVSVTARAEWYGVQVPGVPQDVHIEAADGGWFSVATSAGAFEVKAGAVTQRITDAGSVFINAFVDPTGCLNGLAAEVPGRGLMQLSTCAAPITYSNYVGYKARRTESGATYLTAAVAFNEELHFRPAAQSAWGGALFSSAIPGAQDLLCAVDDSTTPRFAVTDKLGSVISAGATSGETATATSAIVPQLRELSGYSDPVNGPFLLAGANVAGASTSALYRAPLTGASALMFSPLTVPTGTSAVSGVWFELGTAALPNSADGFGMATARVNGGDSILQSRPVPSNTAQEWVPNGLQGSLDGGYSRVVCCDGLLCVVMTGRDAGVNVFVYENRGAPTGDGGTITVKSGASVTISPSVIDPDGDPIFQGTGSVTPNTAGTLAAAGQGSWSFTAVSNVCGAPINASFSADYSDGVHPASAITVPITITPGDPGAPMFSEATVTLNASGSSKTVSIVGTDGGCGVDDAVWTQVGGSLSNLGVTGTGLSRTFTPPTYVCSADGGTATFSVTGLGDAGSSPPTLLTVEVAPWGPPDLPFASPQSVTIDAGSTFVLSADQTHFCAGAPVDTLWAIQSSPDSGVRFNGFSTDTARVLDGGSLTIATDECARSTVQLTAQNETAGQTSATVPVTVDVIPNITAQSVSISTLTAQVADGGIQAKVAADYACAGLLDYGATLTLTRNGVQTAPAQNITFSSAPSLVNFPLPDCAGGTFTVTATLTKAGVPTLSTRTTEVVVPAGTVPAPDVIENDNVVACGTGGTAQLEIPIPASCPDLTYVWTSATDSLPVTISPNADGTQVTVQTVATDPSEVIGQHAQLIVTAMSGGKELARKQVDTQFRSASLLTVEHSTDTPIASDTELFGVDVTLAPNGRLECELHGVNYVEQLSGLTVVRSSIRVNGVPVDPENVEITKQLRIRGIDVPAGGEVRVYYTAKPILFGAPNPNGRASFLVNEEDYPISEPAGFAREQGTTPPTCGCGSTQGVPFAALMLLVLAARMYVRRRHD